MFMLEDNSDWKSYRQTHGYVYTEKLTDIERVEVATQERQVK